MISGVLALLPFLFVLAFQAQGAAEHPVPLDKDFDMSKCVECHTDKAAGTHVHTAVTAMGCAGCHTVTTENDTTKISLTASTPGELCLTCHEESKDEDKHKPYADHQCIVCHDPHETDFPKQARAAMNGLCLECHGDRQIKDKDKVEIFGRLTFTADQFAEIPKTELDKKQKGHPFLGHPVSGGPDPLRKGEDFSCLSCHQPHSAPMPRLLQAEFKELEVCEKCHNAAYALKAAKPTDTTKLPDATKLPSPESGNVEKPAKPEKGRP